MMGTRRDTLAELDEAFLAQMLAQYCDEPDAMHEVHRQRVARLVDFAEFANFCRSDLPTAQAARLLLYYREAHRPLSASELLQLVRRIRKPDYAGHYAEAESLLDIIRFNANCIDPRKDDLLFASSLSDEAIVALALGANRNAE